MLLPVKGQEGGAPPPGPPFFVRSLFICLQNETAFLIG